MGGREFRGCPPRLCMRYESDYGQASSVNTPSPESHRGFQSLPLSSRLIRHRSTLTQSALSRFFTHHTRCTNHHSFPYTLPTLHPDLMQPPPPHNNHNSTFSGTRKSTSFPISKAFIRPQEAPLLMVNTFHSVMLRKGARMPVLGGRRIGWPSRVFNRSSRRTLFHKSKRIEQEQA